MWCPPGDRPSHSITKVAVLTDVASSAIDVRCSVFSRRAGSRARNGQISTSYRSQALFMAADILDDIQRVAGAEAAGK